MASRDLTLTVRVRDSDDGGYIGFVDQLPGLGTQGETLEELFENIGELIPHFIMLVYQKHKGVPVAD